MMTAGLPFAGVCAIGAVDIDKVAALPASSKRRTRVLCDLVFPVGILCSSYYFFVRANLIIRLIGVKERSVPFLLTGL